MLKMVFYREKNKIHDGMSSKEGKNQRNTATAITVVHRPFLSPWADWQTCLVRMILPLAL